MARHKLGLVAGSTLALVHAPADLALAIPPEVSLVERGKADVVVAFVGRKATLAKALASATARVGTEGYLWFAYPKPGALGTDLDRDSLARALSEQELEPVGQVALDAVWSALRVKRDTALREARRARGRVRAKRDASAPPKADLDPPKDLALALSRDKIARAAFARLAPSHVREYVEWITSAKKVETRARRLDKAITMLREGEKRPSG